MSYYPPEIPAESIESKPLPPGTYQPQPQSLILQIKPAKPLVSYSLIGITIFFFLLQMSSQFLLNDDILIVWAAKYNHLIREGEYWRLITPIFLHGSFIHIAFNMYALYVIGPGLEAYYGNMRFLVLYLLAGYAGNVFSFILSPEPSLGASTSIFGLIGAQGIFIYQNRFLFGKKARPLLINIITITLINLTLGLSPRIDNWGHLGGLVGGLIFAWFAGAAFKITGDPQRLVLDEKKSFPRYLYFALIEFVLLSILLAVSL